MLHASRVVTPGMSGMAKRRWLVVGFKAEEFAGGRTPWLSGYRGRSHTQYRQEHAGWALRASERSTRIRHTRFSGPRIEDGD